jgi:hypothetical protein
MTRSTDGVGTRSAALSKRTFTMPVEPSGDTGPGWAATTLGTSATSAASRSIREVTPGPVTPASEVYTTSTAPPANSGKRSWSRVIASAESLPGTV